MCEILLCVKNRGNTGQLLLDCKRPQQGDVIEVLADGWPWGACELGYVYPGNPNGNHNFFRIIKLPNVTVAQASNLLSPELDVDPTKPSPYLQFRAFFIDATKIAANGAAMASLKAHLADVTRASPFISLPYTAAQIQTVVTQRSAIAFTYVPPTPPVGA